MTRIIKQAPRISVEITKGEMEEAWGQEAVDLALGDLDASEKIRLTTTWDGVGWQFEREQGGMWGAYGSHWVEDDDILCFADVGERAVAMKNLRDEARVIFKEHFYSVFDASDRVTTRKIAQDVIGVYSSPHGVGVIDTMGHSWWPDEASAIAEAKSWEDNDAVYGIIILLSLGEDEDEVRAWARDRLGEEVAGWPEVTSWLQ